MYFREHKCGDQSAKQILRSAIRLGDKCHNMSGGEICVLHTNIRVTCRCYIKLGWQGISSSFIILEAISVTLRGGFLVAHPFVFVQCSLSPSILSCIFSHCSEKLFPSTLHDYCPFVLLNLALCLFFRVQLRLLQLCRSSKDFPIPLSFWRVSK